MIAVPFSVPGIAISIALLCTVASTWPSMTSTSQSEMSTPFNLMLTPTASLLVGGSARCSAGGGCTAASTVSTAGSAGEGLREADAPGCAAARELALAVVPRPALTGGS